MIDRQKLETILSRRFPGATRVQIAAAANAIMGLPDEWEEVPCQDVAALAVQAAADVEYRLLRRASS